MRKLISILLGILSSTAILFLSIITILPFDFNEKITQITLCSILAIIISGILLLALKKKKYYAYSQAICTLVILLTLSINSWYISNKYKEKITWITSEESVNIPFETGGEGRFYLQAEINNTAGLFLFDTGAEITAINEKILLNNSIKSKPVTIWDANGLSQTKNIRKAKSFKLGSINAKKLRVYPVDTIGWSNPEGTFYNQDSIVGIIGNNIISKFIWDFDLVSHKVTISNDRNYCNTINDSLAINLIPKGDNKTVSVLINDSVKYLTLDSGCSSPISLTDSVPDFKKFKVLNFGFNQRSKGLFSHLDSTNNSKSGSFVDINLGNYNFQSVNSIENAKKNLLGVPFFWAFERVVIDFGNNKAYFINKNDSLSKYGAKTISNDLLGLILKSSIKYYEGCVKLALREPMELKAPSVENDTIKNDVKIYSRVNLYFKKQKANDYTLDKIVSLDSALINNQTKHYGGYEIKL